MMNHCSFFTEESRVERKKERKQEQRKQQRKEENIRQKEKGKTGRKPATHSLSLHKIDTNKKKWVEKLTYHDDIISKKRK